MASTPQRVSTAEFLQSIDQSLMKYLDDFLRNDFTNETCFKYLRSKDFDTFSTKVSAVHRRMLLNAVAKLQTPQSHLGIESPDDAAQAVRNADKNQDSLKPRKLFTRATTASVDNQSSVNESAFSPGKRSHPGSHQAAELNEGEDDFLNTYQYTSPIENALKDRQNEINVLESELQPLEEQHKLLREKYVPIQKIPGRSQCGKCHQYAGHRANNCFNDPCTTAQQCGDLNARGHEHEKAEMTKLNSNIAKLLSEIKGKKTTLEIKKRSYESSQSSFGEKIHAALIRTNQKKYLFTTATGSVATRISVLNIDKAILDKHFKGKIPPNLEETSTTFQTIIRNFNQEHNRKTQREPTENPIKKRLENNAIYPVTFPAKSATISAPACSDVDTDVSTRQQQETSHAVQKTSCTGVRDAKQQQEMSLATPTPTSIPPVNPYIYPPMPYHQPTAMNLPSSYYNSYMYPSYAGYFNQGAALNPYYSQPVQDLLNVAQPFTPSATPLATSCVDTSSIATGIPGTPDTNKDNTCDNV